MSISKDGAVGTNDLADKAVTTAKLADNSVTSAKMGAGTVIATSLTYVTNASVFSASLNLSSFTPYAVTEADIPYMTVFLNYSESGLTTVRTIINLEWVWRSGNFINLFFYDATGASQLIAIGSTVRVTILIAK